MADTEQIFRDTLHKVAKEHDIHNYEVSIKSISTGGANYASYLFLAKISGREEINLFGKVATFGEKARELIPMKLYDNENYFYNVLSKVYHEIEEKNKVPEEDRLKIPKFYGCNTTLYEETVILEDLNCKGFTILDRLKCFDWEYASAAVSQIAKFHALSMAYQRDNKQAFDDDIKQLVGHWEKNEEQWSNIRKSFMNPVLEAITGENREKLKRYIETNYSTNSYREMVAAKKVEVIVHGDYKPSNMMYRTREDGKVDIIPVDFQTLQGGSPIVDLLYFIYTGSDEEFRRLHYQELVDHYYNELSAAMARLGIDPETYSREDFDDELKEKISFGLFVGLFLLPMVTVDAENVPHMDKDSDLPNLAVKKTGPLFLERFNGIMNDYIRWGILT